MAKRQARGCPSTKGCQVTLAMLKHRWPGRSRVCGLSNARSLWHLESDFQCASLRPKAINILQNLRELVDHSKQGQKHSKPNVLRCPPLRRPARAWLARAASRAPPRRPGTTTRRDAVCCCGRARGQVMAAHTSPLGRRASGQCTHQPERDRGSFPTTIGVRAVSRTRCLCAHSPAAPRVSPAVAAPNQRRPCAQDGRASLT